MEQNGASTSAKDVHGPAAVDAAVVRTFLIVDVRGYTSFTHAHGDEEAGRLAERFAALAREAVTGTGGEVIELRGDEALCVFPSARQALRAAVELQVRFRQRVNGEPVFPLGVGIGLAAGEAVPVEAGYRGGALNLAARLCGLAGPGQILASETVASLAGRVEGVRFVARRGVRVKGLEKPVRAIEVVPEAELPPVPTAPRPRTRQQALPLVAAGVAVLAASLAAALFAITRDSNKSVESVGNAIAAIGGGGDTLAYIPAGTTPSTIAVGEEAVWVLNSDDRTISKIDPETRRIVKTFGTGGITTDLAVGQGAVWVANGAETTGTLGNVYTSSVSRLDPESTSVTKTTTLPGRSPTAGNAGEYRLLGVSQLAAGGGAVWAVNPDLSVSRLDPATGELAARIPMRAGSALAAGSEGIWAVSADAAEVIRIDPNTNETAQRIAVPTGGLEGLAVGAGSLWATDLDRGFLWRIDPGFSEPTMQEIDVGLGVTAVAYGGGAVWATNFVRDELVRVDPRTNKITARIPLPGTPPSVAAAEDAAWVSIAGAPRGDVLPESICGSVVAGESEPDVLIASDLPLQGPSGAVTRIVADAVRFVVREHGFRAGRYAVGYQSCDNSTAQSGAFAVLKCSSNAKTFAATTRVVGVVGPWNSQCAWAQIPIANRADGPLAMISPSNTHPGLTHAAPGTEQDEPERHYPTGVRNYVRVVGPADLEAAAGALLAEELGLRRVYVLTSTEAFPAEIYAPAFTSTAKRHGIVVAGSAQWDPSAKSHRALAERVARTRPDGVFLADQLFTNAGAVIRALRARLGRDLVLIGTEAMFPIPELLRAAGPAATGMYVTTTAIAHEGLGPAGRRFLTEFAATQPGDEVPSALYVLEAAGAAEALLEAIARSDGTRASVNRELRRLKIEDGILGGFRFDRSGDIRPASFTVFRITADEKAGVDDPFAGAVFDRVVRVRAAPTAP